MMKRTLVSLCLLLCLCCTAMANQELTVKLDDKEKIQREDIGIANLTFEYLGHDGNNAIVRVVVENIMSNPPHAVLLFNKDVNEKELKKGKPKIEFVKTYVGKKGTRNVKGFRECINYLKIIPAAVTDTILVINVPFTSSQNFTLPLYEAKYKAKDLSNKGAAKTKFKIMAEHLYDVHIEVVGWTKEDSTYVETKRAVEDYISSLQGVRFCNHKRHKPSLKQQQLPYQNKKESLIQAIRNIIDTHSDWLSSDAPHKAYSELLSELAKVNFDDMTSDCGNHTPPKPKTHTCSFCSMSAEGICQRLDDLYQQLYVGKIKKAQALNTARSLYTCYKKSTKRKKAPAYESKISKFYNSIANY